MKLTPLLIFGILGTALSSSLFASQEASDQIGTKQAKTQTADRAQEDQAQATSEGRRTTNKEIGKNTVAEAMDKRKEVYSQAGSAIKQTREALAALNRGDAPKALDLLAQATGKLELVIARNPEMILAPLDIRYETYDLYATVDGVERAREEAIRLLKDGRVQEARYLLGDLRSDLVVETVSLPIGTYPSAIKAIVPLIDDGLWLEARQALQAALDSLVVTEVIYPLPILRAEHMLARAEDLTENVERNDEQSDQLLRLLRGARREIKLAEALGYGTPDTLKAFHLELDEIVKKTNLGDSGKGFFDKIKSKVHDLLGGNPSE